MKNVRLLFILSVLTLRAFTGLAQITINASDVPIPGSFSISEYNPNNLTNPSTGSNQSWDYSVLTPIATTTVSYITETDMSWVGQGVDVYRERSKSLSPGNIYDYHRELDHNSAGVFEKGIHVIDQAYDLSAVTSNPMDSILFAEQDIVHSTPMTFMPFPLTAGYNNSQSVRIPVDFVINAPAFGLSNTPCQHVWYQIRTDSVRGWGKMRVHTPSGPSGFHDVLMNQIHLYYQDSFYVNGAPISSSLKKPLPDSIFLFAALMGH